MSDSLDSKVPAKHLPSIPLLDAIRPPPGWRTDRAILATYSAQAAVIVAALLALGGQDDERGSGSRIGLARSLAQLRSRAHIIVQAGRLGLSRSPAPILGLLDRFLVQVPWDEGERSWHPKFALIRHVSIDGKSARWKLVLGSRNLTQDTSWDLCISLDGHRERGRHTQSIPGIDRMVRSIASMSPRLAPWKELEMELSHVEWELDPGLSITQLRLMMPEEDDRVFPAPPEGIHRLLAVAPFIDGATVRKLSTWCVDRHLLSTRAELARIAEQIRPPQPQWKAILELPDPDYSTAAKDAFEQAASDQGVDTQNRGLHAKFLLAEHDARSTLWLGSPNLTNRAWTRNAEIYAEIRIVPSAGPAAQKLIDGIWRFANSAHDVSIESLLETNLEKEDELIEEARRQVAARLRYARLRWQASPAFIECTSVPHPDLPEAELFVSRFDGTFIPWVRGETTCVLPDVGPDGFASELIRVRLCWNARQLEWMHVVSIVPPLPEERDDRALRHYLGARQTLAWIRDILTGVPSGDGGGPWDAPKGSIKRPRSKSNESLRGFPSIESALRSWMRSQEPLEEVDRILSMHSQDPRASVDPDERTAAAHLARFAQAWKVLRQGLSRGGRHGG